MKECRYILNYTFLQLLPPKKAKKKLIYNNKNLSLKNVILALLLALIAFKMSADWVENNRDREEKAHNRIESYIARNTRLFYKPQFKPRIMLSM